MWMNITILRLSKDFEHKSSGHKAYINTCDYVIIRYIQQQTNPK